MILYYLNDFAALTDFVNILLFKELQAVCAALLRPRILLSIYFL